MTKIIFLDVDGVLNSELYYRKRGAVSAAPDYSKKSWREYHLSNIDEECIGYLNHLVEVTRAKIVISSTWRMSSTVEALQDLFNAKGFKGDIIGLTPILAKADCIVRGNEILKYIKDNCEMLCGSSVHSDFREYVIFDDDTDMLYDQRYNFIHVDPHCGLTPNHVNSAKYILCHDMTFSKSLEHDKL